MFEQSHVNRHHVIDLGLLSAGAYRQGVPFPRGAVSEVGKLSLLADDKPVSAFVEPLAQWDDGSIKWALIGFCLSQSSSVQLRAGTEPKEKELRNDPPASDAMHTALQWQCLTESGQIRFGNETETLLDASVVIKTAGSETRPLTVQSTQINDRLDAQTNELVATDAEMCATADVGMSEPLHLRQRWSWFRNSPLVRIELNWHNPNAAQHANGLWDLGDPGSIALNSVSLSFSSAKLTNKAIKLESSADWQVIERQAEVTQMASGGDHWNSPVHVDEAGRIPMTQQGYIGVIDGKPLDSGLRASPVVKAVVGTQSLALSLIDFWQEFPASVEVQSKSIGFDLLSDVGYTHELQGGEQKTKVIWLSLDAERQNTPQNFHWQGFALPQQYWLEASALSGFTQASLPMQTLIQQGLSGEACFQQKREQLDEYGWRHFGDLYADHETAGYTGDDLFVSHYNNQYDPLMGFIKQYLLTGDEAWQSLATDLAKHVKDIDIYHTTLDKHEYNGGLFWHTDHYVKACTSTHRSFSQHQDKNVYIDHAGGGGPGGQHCYTTGLAMHYCLSGEESSKNAVLTLTDWIVNFYDGRGTLFEWLLALKNRSIPGLKDHFNLRYPLDRGTGNLVVALLDSYDVSSDSNYLDKAALVIQQTVSPSTDLDALCLDDVENTWFYTVFLQAVYRFLQTKEALGQLDGDFYFARNTLLHFAQWMVAHEQPYLNKPEILEYPNHTWAAQDLRKACVFAAAYYYSNRENAEFHQKAIVFKEYVEETLANSAEQSYTRILAILMQSYGVTEYFLSHESGLSFDDSQVVIPAASYKERGIVVGALAQLLQRLITLSPVEEYRWLKRRLG